MPSPLRIAIVYPGNADARRNATPENNRFAALFTAFGAQGMHAEPAVYHDDFCDEVEKQLTNVDAVLVWVNPIEDGRDRTLLDAMLRRVADADVYVSAHPDVILALGTKEVLFQTKGLGWGSDVHVYRTLDQMAAELPVRLASGKARVLKQYRGHSGIGIWKVQMNPAGAKGATGTQLPIRVRHAPRGNVEYSTTLGEFLKICATYFEGAGRMIDQDYQERLTEGMVRLYLVQDKVGGFGHQAINALYPAASGAPASEAPPAGPRLYYPPTQPEFQHVKQQLESKWLPDLLALMKIPPDRLPIMWDLDFLFGPKAADGSDTYVLCEINVSSVSPFPEWAIPHMVDATRACATRARAQAR